MPTPMSKWRFAEREASAGLLVCRFGRHFRYTHAHICTHGLFLVLTCNINVAARHRKSTLCRQNAKTETSLSGCAPRSVLQQ